MSWAAAAHTRTSACGSPPCHRRRSQCQVRALAARCTLLHAAACCCMHAQQQARASPHLHLVDACLPPRRRFLPQCCRTASSSPTSRRAVCAPTWRAPSTACPPRCALPAPGCDAYSFTCRRKLVAHQLAYRLPSMPLLPHLIASQALESCPKKPAEWRRMLYCLAFAHAILQVGACLAVWLPHASASNDA